ncbi:protein of unknown function [Maridesulfovibrio ferrireducens]|uniref:DUF1937 domain-containing protein n=1 Tax=Maridesulfovibrio ferrireducens TaxID=246191 RepID=A0A1G9EM15_9BACT|nr:DUF1937 family protein [Maridesulfovibrio ferrireducens]SDK77232.1 protein of unknown function [Maridesulfovibrio ferrireducens]
MPKLNPLKIYLACPYTSPKVLVSKFRYEMANVATKLILQSGHLVYSPISHSHGVKSAGNPIACSCWKRLNADFLDWADELWVLKLDGWEESQGVIEELATARCKNKQISYYDPEPVKRLLSSLKIEEQKVHDPFFSTLLNELPPVFSRIDLPQFIGTLFSVGYMSNLDSAGDGPEYRRVGGKIVYERELFVTWLENRCQEKRDRSFDFCKKKEENND